jgi:hypothetical protein
VLVPICSPSYFRSAWCLSEWESFAERERLSDVAGLRVPVRHHDGEHYPDDARQIQMRDLSPFTSLTPSFYINHPRAGEFDDRVKELCADVAAALTRAPDYRDDWPVVEATPVARGPVSLSRL